MQRILAMILAGGQGERLSILSQERAKPAVPFAGQYRIIDFTLSNCANSGISHVAVLTQYRPRSLNDHIGSGKPWDLDRMEGGITLLQPYLGRAEEFGWYSGTADAVYQNLYFVNERQPDLVVVLAGDHIYQMDYSAMIAHHRERDADVTVAVQTVPIEQAHRFGILTVDPSDRVVKFVEKPARPESSLVSMGIYVFDREVLIDCLEEDARKPGSTHDFGRDVLPRLVPSTHVSAYPFEGYWQDVGTIQSYWEANMDFLGEPAPVDLEAPGWRIRTRSEDRGPARFCSHAVVRNSLVCHGGQIEGTVEQSVLSPGVRVLPGAVVRHSILMADTVVGPGAVVDHCIVDKHVIVGEGCQLGAGHDTVPNRAEPERLHSGLTIVGKRAEIPARLVVGRNVRIDPGARPDDFRSSVVPAGETVQTAEPPAV